VIADTNNPGKKKKSPSIALGRGIPHGQCWFFGFVCLLVILGFDHSTHLAIVFDCL
jgi:hypothetical protein